jgi:hydrogenase expression/formation protein HypD
VFEPFVSRYRRPVVVAGFEPLDILLGARAAGRAGGRGQGRGRQRVPSVCLARRQRRALDALFACSSQGDGDWRGIARVPSGDLRLRPQLAAHDASVRFAAELDAAPTPVARADAAECRCGGIMTGLLQPTDCRLFGTSCRPDAPVGACMVSTEGVCRIWHEHGARR